MDRTAYISETEEGTIMIKIVPDRSPLARYQNWIEVSKIELSEKLKEKLRDGDGKSASVSMVSE